MDTKQVAEDAVAMAKAGDANGIGPKYWAENIVSIEAMDGPMARVEGLAAVHAKGEWWEANHTINNLETYGPFVNGDQFGIRWIMDVTEKSSGNVMHFEELALYTVKDGKIVEEKFFPLTA